MTVVTLWAAGELTTAVEGLVAAEGLVVLPKGEVSRCSFLISSSMDITNRKRLCFSHLAVGSVILH